MIKGTVYRVISRNGNNIRIMQDVNRVVEFLQARVSMGRSTRHYIVIKSDARGDRVVNLRRAISADFEQVIRTA